MSATPSAMCTVPGALAGWLCHGTGALRAQSTLTVPGSSWKSLMPRRTRSGTSPRVEEVVVQLRRHDGGHHRPPGVERSRLRCARCERARWRWRCARPGLAQRISPPRERRRRASAWVSSPAPPSGTGNPTVCPIMLIIRAIRPEPGESRGMSAWPALPASRTRGASPLNRLRPRSAAGVSSVRMNRSPPARRRLSNPPSPARTGGNGVSRPRMRCSPITSQSRQRSSHASPSPGCWSSNHEAVSSRSRSSSAHWPSGSGWPSTAGAWRQVRPWSSRWNDLIVGEAAANG